MTAEQVRDTADMGCEGPEPDEGLPALRHGAVPGPAVRPHRDRADRRRSAASTPAEVGYYRLRPPVKPITLAELASLPIAEAERKAVER